VLLSFGCHLVFGWKLNEVGLFEGDTVIVVIFFQVPEVLFGPLLKYERLGFCGAVLLKVEDIVYNTFRRSDKRWGREVVLRADRRSLEAGLFCGCVEEIHCVVLYNHFLFLAT